MVSLMLEMGITLVMKRSDVELNSSWINNVMDTIPILLGCFVGAVIILFVSYIISVEIDYKREKRKSIRGTVEPNDAGRSAEANKS